MSDFVARNHKRPRQPARVRYAKRQRMPRELRKRDIMRLYSEGKTIQRISEELGVPYSTVKNDVKSILADWRAEREELADSMAFQQEEKLHSLYRRLEAMMDHDNPSVVLQAISEATKIIAQVNKMTGLDQPKPSPTTQINVTMADYRTALFNVMPKDALPEPQKTYFDVQPGKIVEAQVVRTLPEGEKDE